MRQLEQFFLHDTPATDRRKIFVVHGLGGIGKTQLAVEFAREHRRGFSGIFWLDGSSEASLKQTFVGMAQRLPWEELTADGVEMLKHSNVDVDVAVRECLRWLSLPLNRHWLLIVDSVDREYDDKDDSQAYKVEDYFPHADHGSILITSRLGSLQGDGPGLMLGTVSTEQAVAILENNARKVVKDADMILERLNGLPLALTQAGSYLRETNVSTSTYVKHYDRTWERLMKKQGRFRLQEYGDRNILTTWTMSYEQVRRQSEEAACLVKLWGCLDWGELWYELIAAALDLSEVINVPKWLLDIAEDELEFADAVGLLSRYSLANAKENTNSHSMHSVLHKWCSQLSEGDERHDLCCLAVGLVASNVPSQSEVEPWSKRKRMLAHVIRVCRWVVEDIAFDARDVIEASVTPWMFQSLGDLLSGEDRLKEAEEMYDRALQGKEKALGAEHTSTLNTVNNLGLLYADQGRLDKAEEMYNRALQGCEKALGAEHTSTLSTVNNIGNLYKAQGWLDKAEEMYNRALQGCEKALGAEHTSTLSTVNNLGNLYADQGRLDKAEEMYNQALQGCKKALGAEHTLTLSIVNNLGNLYKA
ncbi:uncharacterized protein BDZ99DRAFT_153321 [Mytilinidion resinicola]|uniref:NB-ARC domain-containing protein n=1 Tax=Mytilinidion resinicola TaxID=574789 RepID=A0A6A6Y7J7_9PEZI|nr:uncharacterized protein BDZ99DRAFT_153321 [Mytilinidion resinicola]KAF2804503.1 hypothetical protein BDZ99DRAFT_153321 [Mytilinidion resinicola]